IERKSREEEHSRRFNETVQAVHDGVIPTGVLVDASSSREFIQAGAQFLVVDRLLPDVAPERKTQIARMKTRGFVDAIIKHGDGAIGAADIEEMAEMLGIFSDIWPFDSYLQTLRLPTRL